MDDNAIYLSLFRPQDARPRLARNPMMLERHARHRIEELSRNGEWAIIRDLASRPAINPLADSRDARTTNIGE